MSDNKFRHLMVPVARHYWGPENHAQSNRRELRWGTNGSKSVSVAKGVWMDHEEEVGGGVVDLIRREEGQDADIPAILERTFGLPRNSDTGPVKSEIVFDYVNIEGEVMYQAVRIDTHYPDKEPSKTYTQRRMVDGRPVPGMTGVTALPYRLPELDATPIGKVVFICEGEKAVEAVRHLGLPATTNHGGAGKWWDSITPYFAGRKVIICPDNDPAGERHLQKVGAALTGVADSIRVLRLPGLPHKGDAHDWVTRGGTREQFIDLARDAEPFEVKELGEDEIPDAPEAKPATPPIRIYSYDEMAHMPPVEWQVDDVLPARAKTVLFGVSNAFKSFLAIDLACSVATGKDWHGKHARQGNVLYIATEGAFGVGRKRIPAWMAHHKVPAELRRNIRMIAGDVVIKGDMVALMDAIVASFNGPVALVVVDVLAGTMDGSESDDEAAREWVNAATQLVMKLQAAMLVVTHSPYSDDARMRGHSHIWGSFDTRLKAEGDKDSRTTTLAVNRHKDHDSTGEWSFKLEEHPTDEHPLETSLVPVMQADGAQQVQQREPLRGHQKDVFEALQYAAQEAGITVGLDQIPHHARCVKLSMWRSYYYQKSPLEPETRKKAFQRASSELVRKGTCGVWADYAWITES